MKQRILFKNYFKIFFIGCVCSFGIVTASIAQEVDISAEAFGILPEYSNMQISPDGSKLLMLKQTDDKMLIVTKELNDPSSVPISISVDIGKVQWASWVSNEKILASVETANLTKIKHFVRTDRFLALFDWTGEKQEILSSPDVVDFLIDDPDHILVRKGTSFIKLNLVTKEEAIMPGRDVRYRNVVTDKDHNVRFATSNSRGFSVIDQNFTAYYRKTIESEWRELYDFDVSLGLGKKTKKVQERPFTFEGFTNDPNIIYISKKDDNKNNSLFTYHVDTKKTVEKIATHEKYDLYSFGFDKENNLDYYYYFDGRTHVVYLGEHGQKLNKILSTSFPDTNAQIQSASKDKKKYIVRVSSPTDPGTFYLLDLDANKIEMLSFNYQKVDVSKLSEMQQISYIARDGLEINGYLSFPAGSNGKNLPTIIMPHDGPVARDNWGYDYRVQFLTTRGYAVLQMNFRGSTGYGFEFRQKGRHEWGRKMLEDINDGAKWMIDQGYADPKRVCLVGEGFGGYAALQSIVKDQSLYKCSAAIAPITDLEVRFGASRTNFVESKDWTYKEASPHFNIDKINVPVLLVNEERHVGIPIKNFYEKMNKSGKNVTYVKFEYDDKYLYNHGRRIVTLRELENFLKNNL